MIYIVLSGCVSKDPPARSVFFTDGV